MTATQLALGIFFGFGSLEIFKIVVASIYENHRRNAMKKDVEEMATDFIDKMHNEIEAEKAAEAAKKARRRKPVAKKAPARKSVVKKPITKSKSQQRREAVLKAGK